MGITIVTALQRAVMCIEEWLAHGKSLLNMSWLVSPLLTTPVRWWLLSHCAGEKTEAGDGVSAQGRGVMCSRAGVGPPG